MSGGRVVVFGSLHLDIMVEAPARPLLGETVVGQSWSLKPGGKGGNQAVAAAMHGAATAMLGAVGNDAFGQTLRDNLRAHSVDLAGVAVMPGQESGISIAIVEESGDYGAIIVSGVNLSLGDAAVPDAALRDAAWLVLQNEIPEAANLAAAMRARRFGVRVLLNAAPARPLDAALLSAVDILVVNALEAESLCDVIVTNLQNAAQAAETLLLHVACAIVTAGGAGLALASRDGTRLTLRAHAVTLVSTHGAGDCFVGALAARLALGDALADALAYGNAAAALLVATPDDARATLRPEHVLAML